MPEMTWRFPGNDTNETEGPNDGGITHFTSNRFANVIRESIQNSLDAQADLTNPVLVHFDLTTLSPETFGVDSLLQALDAAIVSKHNDVAHSRQFRKGRDSLVKEPQKTTVLRIIDRNTSGANDDLALDGKPTKWEALTKSTGLSIKDQQDAGGSYGLGKHAPFALTDIRTVLYSTAWNSKGQMQYRFQGKAILVSHEGRDGKKYRRTGYLGGDNFSPLKGNEVPPDVRLEEPGLAVYVLGYEPEKGWQDKCMSSAVEHFFHAIVHNGLEVRVEEQCLNDTTLDTYLGLVSNSTVAFVNVSRTEPVAQIDMPDIGHVTLRLVTGESNKQTGRQIALVRDAGMMITDRPRDMGLPGLGRFPPHWQPFTAVIECRSSGKQSLLRESESPSHNNISTQQISDPQLRRRANDALKELGYWCRDEIRARVEHAPTGEIENVTELAKYLGIREEEGTSSGTDTSGNFQMMVTQPEQSATAPPGNWARRGRRSQGQTTGGEGEENHPHRKGKGKSSRRPGTTTRPIPTAFSRVRFRPGIRRPTHSIVVTFDSVAENLRNIQLMAAVEDGPDVQIGIREAYVGNRKLTVRHNKVTSYTPGKDERCSIEFLTQVPVANKAFYLLYGGS